MRRVAHVRLRLRSPITVAGLDYHPVVLEDSYPGVESIEVRPISDQRGIFALECTLVAQDADLRVLPVFTVVVRDKVIDPGSRAFWATRRALRTVAAMTFQPELIRALDDEAWCVESADWAWNSAELELRARTKIHNFEFSYKLAEPCPHSVPLTPELWGELPKRLSDPSLTPPWRSIFLDAYESWHGHDVPGTVLRAASALDVGMAQFSEADFSAEVFTRPPYSLARDHPICCSVRELWHTRSAIMHRGRTELFDKRPARGVDPKAPLTDDDVRRFLHVVPEALELAATFSSTRTRG